MKKLVVIGIMLYSFMGFSQSNDNTLRVASFNIRMNSPNDGNNIWENRKEWLTKSINFFNIEVVGTQEVTYTQLEDMKTLLPEYQNIGVGREGGNKGEFSAIFYLKDRLEVLESNTFWLSETPDTIASKGWDAALPRIVTWAKFRSKQNGNTFYFFNTHFDHRGKEARKNSAKLISEKIKEIAGEAPVILTGDFNAIPDSEPHKVLLSNQLNDVFLTLPEDKIYSRGYTFNGWDVEAEGEYSRIDYVFFKGESISPMKYHVLDGQRGKLFISDHFPVIVDFKWENSSSF